jgi:hypothetical protein
MILDVSVDALYNSVKQKTRNNLTQWYFVSSQSYPDLEQAWRSYTSEVAFVNTNVASESFHSGITKLLKCLRFKANLLVLSGCFDLYTFLSVTSGDTAVSVSWVFPETMMVLSIFFEMYRMIPLSMFMLDLILACEARNTSEQPCCASGYISITDTPLGVKEEAQEPNNVVSTIKSSKVNDPRLSRKHEAEGNGNEPNKLSEIEQERMEKLAAFVVELFKKRYKDTGSRLLDRMYLMVKFMNKEDELEMMENSKVIRSVLFSFDHDSYYALEDESVFLSIVPNQRFKPLYDMFLTSKDQRMIMYKDCLKYFENHDIDFGKESLEEVLKDAEGNHVIKLVLALTHPPLDPASPSLTTRSQVTNVENTAAPAVLPPPPAAVPPPKPSPVVSKEISKRSYVAPAPSYNQDQGLGRCLTIIAEAFENREKHSTLSKAVLFHNILGFNDELRKRLHFITDDAFISFCTARGWISSQDGDTYTLLV